MNPHAAESIAVLLGAGVAADVMARLARVPAMLGMICAGVVLGPEVTGVLELPVRSPPVQLLLSLGVGAILFYGGLGLSLRLLRPVAVGVLLLAVPGVLLTAAIVGAASAALFGLPLAYGLVIGALVAPTDPAILIPLFDRLHVRAKVVQTLVAEAALNDVVAALLTLVAADAVLSGHISGWHVARELGLSVVVSGGAGLAIGLLLARSLSHGRFGLCREAPALAVLTAVVAAFAVSELGGGSGYLGAFVAGVTAGNCRGARLVEARVVASTVSEIVVPFIFISIGAGLSPGNVWRDGAPALATVAVLILVARPLTATVCLVGDRCGRWRWQEIAFIAWTRETGVLAAALAGLVAAKGVAHASTMAAVVTVAVVVTLSLQATTKRWLCERLSLSEPGEPCGPQDGSVSPGSVSTGSAGRVAAQG